MTLIERIFRNIFFLLDDVVYNQIPKFYNLLITIARTSPLSQANITDLASRIYKLLAVFMVFKVTLSLIMYVVNPDDFSDKSKGISKLITNIVISLAVLVLTPYIFNYGYQFQEMILKDNSLAAVIFGDKLTSENNIINDAGDQMAYLAITPFITPNLNYFNCTSVYSQNIYDGTDLNYDCFGFTDVDDYMNSGDVSCHEGTLCEAVEDVEDSKYLRKDDVINYAAGISNSNFNYIFRKSLVTTFYDGTKDFAFDYAFGISTVVGVIIVLFLLTSCMDIGLRSIKLAFLQLIAPIPIISYIDPKSGKDGMFKKWYQMCFKTYLSLFIKILAIYFATYIIGNLHRLVDVIDGSYVTNGYIEIFIMIGALMFAKNFTKILEGLGVKLDGGFTLNPIKKINEQMLGGKRLTGAAGALTAAAVDRTARVATTPGRKKIGALVGIGGPGLVGSAIRGFRGGKGFSGGLSSQASVNRRLREGRIKGLSPVASYFDYAGSIFGLDDATLERESSIINQNKEAIRKADVEIADYSRTRELKINSNKRKITPAKDIQSRRKSALESATKMQNMAEDIASKKADFKMSAAEKAKIDLLNKAKIDSNSLTASELTELANHGIDVSNLNNSAALAYERAANKRSYTTNRRADEANVRHLIDNQGKVAERDMIIGGVVDKNGNLKEGTYCVIKQGMVIDANTVAQAQAAQGAYIKASKKEVFDALLNGDAIKAADGKSLDEESQFQADLESYRTNVRLANDATASYNKGLTDDFIKDSAGETKAIRRDNYVIRDLNSIFTEAEDVRKINSGVLDFDLIDKVANNIKSSEETSRLDGYVSAYETENSQMSTEIEQYKNNKVVQYYDDKNKKYAYTYDRATSENKAREDANKHRLEQHQQRRSYISDMANKK